MVSQQLLTYGLCGPEMNVSSDMLSRYRKGTNPQGWRGQVDSTEVKALAVNLIKQTVVAYRKGLFEKVLNARFL